MSKFSFKTITATYANYNCGALLALGFASGLPYSLLFMSLSIWLREAKIALDTIGFASLIGLLYAFKWVWASIIDQINLPFLHKLGRRKSYLIASQIMLFLSLLALACFDPAHSLLLVLIWAILVAFSSATQDCVIDAYRLEIAPQNQQAALAASYMLGYRIAILLAGAGTIYLAASFGSSLDVYSYVAWRNSYLIMALFLVPIIFLSFKLSEPKATQINTHNLREIIHKLCSILLLIALLWAGFNLIRQIYGANLRSLAALLGLIIIIFSASPIGRYCLAPSLGPIKDFILRYKSRAILILAIIATFRMADSVMGVMANVFYLDLGFSKEEIASVSKVFGLIVATLGTGLGGILIMRFELLSVLLWAAILCAATNLLFYVLNEIGPSIGFLILTISFDNLSTGVASSAFVAYLSSFTNLKFSASQYAFLSSMMLLLPRLVGGYSGVMVENFGYGNFFVLTAIMGIPVILLILLQIYLTKSNKF